MGASRTRLREEEAWNTAILPGFIVISNPSKFPNNYVFHHIVDELDLTRMMGVAIPVKHGVKPTSVEQII